MVHMKHLILMSAYSSFSINIFLLLSSPNQRSKKVGPRVNFNPKFDRE